jgi:hypothetical protein
VGPGGKFIFDSPICEDDGVTALMAVSVKCEFKFPGWGDSHATDEMSANRGFPRRGFNKIWINFILATTHN